MIMTGNEILQKNRKLRKGVKGDAPLGLPPPLGERGGHAH